VLFGVNVGKYSRRQIGVADNAEFGTERVRPDRERGRSRTTVRERQQRANRFRADRQGR